MMVPLKSATIFFLILTKKKEVALSSHSDSPLAMMCDFGKSIWPEVDSAPGFFLSTCIMLISVKIKFFLNILVLIKLVV